MRCAQTLNSVNYTRATSRKTTPTETSLFPTLLRVVLCEICNDMKSKTCYTPTDESSNKENHLYWLQRGDVYIFSPSLRERRVASLFMHHPHITSGLPVCIYIHLRGIPHGPRTHLSVTEQHRISTTTTPSSGRRAKCSVSVYCQNETSILSLQNCTPCIANRTHVDRRWQIIN